MLDYGRLLVAISIIILVVCLFPASPVHAASHNRVLTETIALSDSVHVHKYSPILESISLSDSLVANNFTPRSESLPIVDSLQVTVYRLNNNDVSENLLFSDALGVNIYRYYFKYVLGELSLSDSLVANNFTPQSESLSIADSLQITVNGLNKSGVSENLRYHRLPLVKRSTNSIIDFKDSPTSQLLPIFLPWG